MQFALLEMDKTFAHLLKVLSNHYFLVQTLKTNVLKQSATSYHVLSFSQYRLRCVPYAIPPTRFPHFSFESVAAKPSTEL